MFGLFSSAKVLARNIIHPTITTHAGQGSISFPKRHSKQGELFADRYEVIDQLGSGLYTNVLLVRDIRYGLTPIQSLLPHAFSPGASRLAPMKVLTSELTKETRGPDECGIMKLLQETNPQWS